MKVYNHKKWTNIYDFDKKKKILIIHAEYSLVWSDKPPMCLKVRKLTQLTKFSVTKKIIRSVRFIILNYIYLYIFIIILLMIVIYIYLNILIETRKYIKCILYKNRQ